MHHHSVKWIVNCPVVNNELNKCVWYWNRAPNDKTSSDCITSLSFMEHFSIFHFIAFGFIACNWNLLVQSHGSHQSNSSQQQSAVERLLESAVPDLRQGAQSHPQHKTSALASFRPTKLLFSHPPLILFNSKCTCDQLSARGHVGLQMRICETHCYHKTSKMNEKQIPGI